MNKNILILAAAVGAYALLRPKNTTTLATTTRPASTGAATYVPTTTAGSTVKPAGWQQTATNVVGAAATGVSIIKTGASVWGDLKDIFHIGSAAPATASATASDYAGGGDIWAGPQYQTS